MTVNNQKVLNEVFVLHRRRRLTFTAALLCLISIHRLSLRIAGVG